MTVDSFARTIATQIADTVSSRYFEKLSPDDLACERDKDEIRAAALGLLYFLALRVVFAAYPDRSKYIEEFGRGIVSTLRADSHDCLKFNKWTQRIFTAAERRLDENPHQVAFDYLTSVLAPNSAGKYKPAEDMALLAGAILMQAEKTRFEL